MNKQMQNLRNLLHATYSSGVGGGNGNPAGGAGAGAGAVSALGAGLGAGFGASVLGLRGTGANPRNGGNDLTTATITSMVVE